MVNAAISNIKLLKDHVRFTCIEYNNYYRYFPLTMVNGKMFLESTLLTGFSIIIKFGKIFND